MLQYDFDSSVSHSMFMAAHSYERALNLELAPEGITNRQCQVLAWLALDGELSQSELAERMSIEPPTLVGILDRMERDELLTRSSCAVDRRRKLIKPLPRAEAIWKKILACSERVQARALKDIPAEQVQGCKLVLDSIRANLHREPALKTA